ncbi:MAG: DegV family protein [Oscillospiraceae bacterium]|nr:DegV family protein [Oscillospiraceae bacterium]
MSKTKIITDSASDISREDEAKYGIHVLCFPITVGERSFRDRDISVDEYYEILDTSDTIPVHSQITPFEFVDVYKRYASAGYTDIIFVSINSYGSSTYQNSLRAKELFAEEEPALASQVTIRCVDSLSYSGTYGFPVIEAAKSAMEGVPADDIEKKLRSRFENAQVYLACYTLKFCKKSGRISAAAAFAGELLGFRPIILLSGKGTKTLRKVRGDANIIPALVEVCTEHIRNKSDYIIIGGKEKAHMKELADALTKKLGYPPLPYEFRVGGAVGANAGPDVVAFAIFDSDTPANK